MAKITLTLPDSLAKRARVAAFNDDRKLASFIRKSVMEKLERENLSMDSKNSEEGAV